MPAPEGDRVAYLGATTANLALFAVPVHRGSAAPVQPDPLHQYLDLDWR